MITTNNNNNNNSTNNNNLNNSNDSNNSIKSKHHKDSIDLTTHNLTENNHNDSLPIDQSLQSFQLLQAFRSSDTHSILKLLNSPHLIQLNPLHTAVRCAKYHIVELVLANLPPTSLTNQDPSGQTPLHIASSHARVDVVSLLLAHPQVDDSIRDHHGRTCLEVAKGAQVAKLIQASRDQLSASFLALLSAYIASPQTSLVSSSIVNSSELSGNPSDVIPSSTAINNHESAADQLYKFMNRPRCRSIDFSLKEEQTGTTLLHEAAKRKDLNLIKLAITRGADVLARDKRGKMPIDISVDEKIRNVLRQAASSEGRSLRATKTWIPEAQQSPLSVSTNSISPSGNSSSNQPTLKGYLSKWTNMARGYSTRWLVLEKGFLSYYRDQFDEGKTLRGSIAMSVAIVVGPDVTRDKLRFEVSSKLGNSYPRFYLKGAHPLEVIRWVDALKQAIQAAKQSTTPALQQSSPPKSSITIPNHEKASFVSRHIRSSRHIPSYHRRKTSLQSAHPHENVNETDSPPRSVFGHSTSEDDDLPPQENDTPPFENELNLLVQSLKAQIEMSAQLVDSLSISTASSIIGSTASNSSTPDGSPSFNSAPNCIETSEVSVSIAPTGSHRQIKVQQALKRSIEDINVILDDYLSKISKRERYHVRRYEEELQAKRLWEENMQALLASQAEMERQLQSVARGSSRRKKQLRSLRAGINGSSATVNTSNLDVQTNTIPETSIDSVPKATSAATSPAMLPPISSSEDEDDDEDDEFFEAIETGAIAIEPMTVTKSHTSAGQLPEFDIATLIEGYETKRTTLPITADDRPSVSLWGILKNSIGKDLTKISFPVSFNEPVSMLQRMAEDMQFSECLDAAAEQSDSLVRLAYVAGFAMSNYSSTVGRLAKPFNPLLGETYEFVDPDKEFRYFSEQISHHPPTSACYAESPRWSYFGETDAKNKFTGKSFEIKPTGVAHAVLNIPKSFQGTQDYPPSKRNADLVEEHYSWKKVTTIISNFFMGSPTIDHYGDMEITNHRTGEMCLLTFKPRGWRGKDANEVKGSIYDKDGELVWELAGKWTTQLIGRRAGSASGDLAPDELVSTRVGREYLQLWKNDNTGEGSTNLPFNLTKFAITLNAINEKLKIWLPPTDSRLRPDQHAFEKGMWERANELKTSLEEYQRLTRRKRDMGELPQHRPRWFVQVHDPDSGEPTWDAIRIPPTDGIQIAYWEERKRVGLLRKQDAQAEWNDVTHIFGEFASIED